MSQKRTLRSKSDTEPHAMKVVFYLICFEQAHVQAPIIKVFVILLK